MASTKSSTYQIRTTDGIADFSAADGHVLPHEHLLLDLRVWWEGDASGLELDDPGMGVVPTRLFDHRRVPQGTSRENLVLSDWYLAAVELRKARHATCQLVVDLTTTGLNPQRSLASKAASLAGVPLVASVGRYIDASLTDEQRGMSASALAEEWGREVEAPTDGVQRGVIGEIGTSATITPAERNSLTAAAEVQDSTGLAINVHLHPFAQQGHAVLDILESAGANLDHVALSHCDAAIDTDMLESLAGRGAYVEMDLFGTDAEWTIDGRGFSTDDERLRVIERFVEADLIHRLLASHDICMKNELTRFGGWGYEHIGRRILPRVVDEFGSHTATTVFADNPLRLLCLTEAEPDHGESLRGKA